MGLHDLLTVDQAAALRIGKPILKGPTRLDEKTAADKDDAKLLLQVARDVRARDQGHCRVCKIRTLVTLELDPRRGECHHIVSRTCQAVRHDVRNCLHVCLKCHGRFKGRGVRLHVVGSAAHMFQTERGQWYLDASYPLEFKEQSPC